MPRKDGVIYQETYRKGSRMVRRALLPERFPYMAEEARIVDIEVRSAGRMERDGEEIEFQDVRVYVRVP